MRTPVQPAHCPLPESSRQPHAQGPVKKLHISQDQNKATGTRPRRPVERKAMPVSPQSPGWGHRDEAKRGASKFLSRGTSDIWGWHFCAVGPTGIPGLHPPGASSTATQVVTTPKMPLDIAYGPQWGQSHPDSGAPVSRRKCQLEGIRGGSKDERPLSGVVPTHRDPARRFPSPSSVCGVPVRETRTQHAPWKRTRLSAPRLFLFPPPCPPPPSKPRVLLTEPSDALAPTLSPRAFQHTSKMPPVPR